MPESITGTINNYTIEEDFDDSRSVVSMASHKEQFEELGRCLLISYMVHNTLLTKFLAQTLHKIKPQVYLTLCHKTRFLDS